MNLDRHLRTWDELTLSERDVVLAQYYSLGASEGLWERPVNDIIEDLSLRAQKHDFPAFFPTLPSKIPCEVCGEPLALKAMTRIGLKTLLRSSPDGSHPPELQRHIPAGQTKPVFYHPSRTAPCAHCGHIPNHPQNCPCEVCKSAQKAVAQSDWELGRAAHKELERMLAQRTLDRTRERFHRRMRLQLQAETARQTLPITLPPEVIDRARAILHFYGRIEADGGLWLTLGTERDLPPFHQLPSELTPFDPWTIVALLQAAGIVRLVDVRLEVLRDEQHWPNPVPVAEYVLTIEPPIAQALGLLDEATSTIWDAADLDAFETLCEAPEGAEG